MSLSKNLSKFDNLRKSTEDIVKEEYKSKFMPPEKTTVIEKLDKQLSQNKTIAKICKKFKIKPIYFLAILLTPVIVLLLTFFTFTTTMISTLYPLYMSFKTLQYKVNKDKVGGKLYKKEDEDKNTAQWLSYWLLYAFINNSECILGSLVDKIPLYRFFKFIFLLCCFLPQVQLSVLIYNYLTSKLFELYGEKLENSTILLMQKIFSNKNSEESTEESNPFKKADSNDLIDDDFNKRKKIE